MPLRSIRSDLLVRHCFVAVARYLNTLGVNGSLPAHALLLRACDNDVVDEAVCYFAVKSVDCSHVERETTAFVVVVRLNEILTGSFNAAIYHESECPDLLDCPREILEMLTPTTCENSRLWRRKCLSRRFAEQYGELASQIPYEPANQ